jgi:hypothetical protein
MKIRIGFVSNSSSASYLVPLGAFENVFDLAEKIIKIRDEEWKDEAGPSWDTQEKLQRAREKGISPDTPIQFQTCNYATWIKKMDEGFVVETCNNHCEIGYLMNECNAKYAQDHRDLSLEKYAYGWGKENLPMQSERFYFLEIEKFGHKKYTHDVHWRDVWCDKKKESGYSCNNSILVLDDGTEICTKCELGYNLD